MVAQNASAMGMQQRVNQHRTISTIRFGHHSLKVVENNLLSRSPDRRDDLYSGVDGWRAVNQSGHAVPVYSDTGSYIYVQSLPGQDLTFEAPG